MQASSLIVTNVILWCGILTVGKDMCVGGRGREGIWKICVSSFAQFCCVPNITLRNSLFNDLIIYLKISYIYTHRQKGKKKEKSSMFRPLVYSPDKSYMTRTGPGWSQELRVSSRLICVAGTQALGPSSIAFSRLLLGSGIRSVTAMTQRIRYVLLENFKCTMQYCL